MKIDRRAIVAGLSTVASFAPAPLGAETRSGRVPTTRRDWDLMIGSAFGTGGFTCVRAEPIDEGPFYYESSPLRRTIAERLAGARLRLGITLGRSQAGAFPWPGPSLIFGTRARRVSTPTLATTCNRWTPSAKPSCVAIRSPTKKGMSSSTPLSLAGR